MLLNYLHDYFELSHPYTIWTNRSRAFPAMPPNHKDSKVHYNMVESQRKLKLLWEVRARGSVLSPSSRSLPPPPGRPKRRRGIWWFTTRCQGWEPPDTQPLILLVDKTSWAGVREALDGDGVGGVTVQRMVTPDATPTNSYSQPPPLLENTKAETKGDESDSDSDGSQKDPATEKSRKAPGTEGQKATKPLPSTEIRSQPPSRNSSGPPLPLSRLALDSMANQLHPSPGLARLCSNINELTKEDPENAEWDFAAIIEVRSGAPGFKNFCSQLKRGRLHAGRTNGETRSGFPQRSHFSIRFPHKVIC